jgi:adenylate kinase family enzyme
MQRLLIIGPCGSGKSTLAQRLGPLLNLPVVHLDALNWQPGWVMAPDDVFRARTLDVLRRPRWIIDGNYGGSVHLRIAHADTVIFLDFPRWRCVARVLKRVWRYAGTTRPDMGVDCPEKFDWEFMDFVWHWFESGRVRLLSRINAMPRDKRLIVLRAPREVDRFVEEVKSSAHSSIAPSNNLVKNTY